MATHTTHTILQEAYGGQKPAAVAASSFPPYAHTTQCVYAYMGTISRKLLLNAYHGDDDDASSFSYSGDSAVVVVVGWADAVYMLLLTPMGGCWHTQQQHLFPTAEFCVRACD